MRKCFLIYLHILNYKYREKKVKLRRVIINVYFFISILTIFIMCIFIKEYKTKINELDMKKYAIKKLNLYDNIEQKLSESVNTIKYPKVNILEKYKGYEVDARLEIPDINLDTYILKNFSEAALNVSVSKFWGPEVNSIGNYCVAGHNFRNEKMFKNLKKLDIGNRIFVSDNKMRKSRI